MVGCCLASEFIFVEVAMDTTDKKRLQQELRKREKQAFIDSLPMSQELFKRLFDCLDERLEQGCNHTLDITLEFLENNDIPVNTAVEWLNRNGAYCDCEVLANIEEPFM